MKEASRNKFTDNSNLKSLTITQKKKGIFFLTNLVKIWVTA